MLGDILFDMQAQSFTLKQTSYHKNIQASEQHNDAAGENFLVFKYHAYCTALSVIQKYVGSKSTVIMEETEGEGTLAVVFGGLRGTM
jgi:hypothetical protein